MRIYTLTIFIEKAIKKHNNYYTYNSSVYINSKSKIEITCPKHGPFWQMPSAHLNGEGCPNCFRERINKKNTSNTEKFIIKANNIHNFKFNYDKTKYVKCMQKIIITCPVHGDFLQKPNNHLNGQNCPLCAKMLTQKEFVDRSNVIQNFKFSYFKTVYTGIFDKVIITCAEHGDFLQIPNDHLHNNQGCPKCNESFGEKEIRKILNKFNIEFCSQYRLKDCRNKLPLPFDFSLMKNNKLCGLIEYQGQQHYRSIDFNFKNKTVNPKNLEHIQFRDNIKQKYCVTNNIPLLIIPYWHKNTIESIIEIFLKSIQLS